MNFDVYTDLSVVTAVDLVNTAPAADAADALTTPGDLRRFLDDHLDSYARPVTPGDVDEVRRLRDGLRSVFGEADVERVVGLLNRLLAEVHAVPQLTDHDGIWHFHYTPAASSLVAHMTAEAAMGLACVVRDHGLGRLRRCAADGCSRVFVDTSHNRSRRYCNPKRCGNRMNVAAFRARQRSSMPA